jgi:diguanylate cyclase (GGDEF)-like protein
MVGVHIFFPSLREVHVIKPAPRDPFAVQAVPVSQLFRYSTEPGLLRRVHVRGSVTLDWPGHMLCIEDARDGICMETAQASAVRTGTLVDVVGFPVIHQFKPTLEDATFRPAQQSSQPLAPVMITGGEMPNDALDGMLARVDAELIGKDLAAENPTLMLRSGQFIFPAILPRGESIAALKWKEGSTVRLTGIWSVDVDPLSTNLSEGGVRTGSIRLLLQDASQVVVKRAPSWWTPEHAVSVFAGVGVVMLASFAWIVVLGHRVERQTEALRSSEARLRHLSEHDALTGLPNRILLNDRLLTALLRVERFGGCLGLLMVDADGFKQINDRYGHGAGDTLLCELAGRLTGCVRTTDTIARIGGDEFIALLPDLHVPADAEAVARKIIDAASRPVRIDRAEVAITVSIGMVTYPDGEKDPETLIHRADTAMYAAKQNGKNGFEIYDPRMAEPAAGEETPMRPSSHFPLLAGSA